MADRANCHSALGASLHHVDTRKPDIRTIDLHIADRWKKFTASTNIPYLGVAAHVDWVKKIPPWVSKLYAAYKDAAEWVAANPVEAAS